MLNFNFLKKNNSNSLINNIIEECQYYFDDILDTPNKEFIYIEFDIDQSKGPSINTITHRAIQLLFKDKEHVIEFIKNESFNNYFFIYEIDHINNDIYIRYISIKLDYDLMKYHEIKKKKINAINRNKKINSIINE